MNLTQHGFLTSQALQLLIVLMIELGLVLSSWGAVLNSNADFEAWTSNGPGGPPDDWTLSGANIAAAQESTVVSSGSYSARLYWTTQVMRSLDQLVTGITAGNFYRFSAYIYDNDPAGEVRITINWEDSGDNLIGDVSSLYSVTSPSWQLLNTDWALAPANTAQCRIKIKCYDKIPWDGDATLYVDQAQLESPSGPPEIMDAYSTSSMEMIVIFDQAVEQDSASSATNYSLTGSAAVSFSLAQRDNDDHKTVYLSGASPAMTGDTTIDVLHVNGVIPEGGGPAASDETFTLYAGITPISNVQQDLITSNVRLTVKGRVTATDKWNQLWIADSGGAFNGIMIYDPMQQLSPVVNIGDDITIAAEAKEYDGLTELSNHIYFSQQAKGQPVFEPVVITCTDIEETLGNNQLPAEQYEGVLCHLNNVQVESYINSSYYEYRVYDLVPHFAIIDDDAWHQYGGSSLTIGLRYNITGILHWSWNRGTYQLCPRRLSDLRLLTSVPDWPLY